ncbi:hypothetical protein SETIT_3G290200v2 [Setaria italica]|uniref:Uncharacterized protein n=1 Tax=Setaria italica TaxID=4555 RepID=A0A368QKP7_SETIT|nr:hypothetical protein SETIT_3G290200v2 [Setaria italica]
MRMRALAATLICIGRSGPHPLAEVVVMANVDAAGLPPHPHRIPSPARLWDPSAWRLLRQKKICKAGWGCSRKQDFHSGIDLYLETGFQHHRDQDR